MQRRGAHVFMQMGHVQPCIDGKPAMLGSDSGGYLARVTAHLGSPKYRSNNVPRRTKFTVLIERADSGKRMCRQWNKHLGKVLEQVVHLVGRHRVEMSDKWDSRGLDRFVI